MVTLGRNVKEYQVRRSGVIGLESGLDLKQPSGQVVETLPEAPKAAKVATRSTSPSLEACYTTGNHVTAKGFQAVLYAIACRLPGAAPIWTLLHKGEIAGDDSEPESNHRRGYWVLRARLTELVTGCKSILKPIERYSRSCNDVLYRSRVSLAGYSGIIPNSKGYAMGKTLLHVLFGWPGGRYLLKAENGLGYGDRARGGQELRDPMPDSMRRKCRPILTRLGILEALSFNGWRLFFIPSRGSWGDRNA